MQHRHSVSFNVHKCSRHEVLVLKAANKASSVYTQMLTPRCLCAQSSKTRPVQFIHKFSRHEVLVLKAAKQGQFRLYTNAHATKSWCSKQQNKASSVYTQMLTPRRLGAQSSKTRPVQFIHKCIYTALPVEKKCNIKILR